MTDVVDRLRTYVACDGGDLADVAEAADEIERLQEQLHLAEVVRASQVEGLTQGAAGWRERANQLEAEAAQLRQYLDAAQRRASALGDEVAGLREVLEGLDEAYCRAGAPLTREQRTEDRKRLIAARAALAARKGTTPTTQPPSPSPQS